MIKKSNAINTRTVIVVAVFLLAFIPSLVCATPMTDTVVDDGNILATVAMTKEALSDGQWMYTYTLANDPGGVNLSQMYIGWELDAAGQPLSRAMEIGILGDDGEKAASYYVPPASPYQMMVYEGITFWDFAITYSSTFRFDLDPGEELPTVYVIYDDYVEQQSIFLGGSPGTSEPINHGEQPSSPVPEPGTLLLLGSGLFGLGVLGRRKLRSL